MTNKIISIAAALLMGFTFSSFAGTPKEDTKTEAKEAKTESVAEAEATTAVVRWFHFIGDASNSSQLNNPDYYEPEAAPTCSSTPNTFRCDIQILSQEDDVDLPDLSKPILAQRQRPTANP